MVKKPDQQLIDECDPKVIDYIDHLERRDAFLKALEDAGVDNWDGYDFAQEMME